MMVLRPALVALGLIVALRPGCGPYEPDKPQKKEGQKLPPHCLQGSDPCYVGCIERQEGQICGSCCFEQLILCDEGHAYDFKKCETAARNQ